MARGYAPVYRMVDIAYATGLDAQPAHLAAQQRMAVCLSHILAWHTSMALLSHEGIRHAQPAAIC